MKIFISIAIIIIILLFVIILIRNKRVILAKWKAVIIVILILIITILLQNVIEVTFVTFDNPSQSLLYTSLNEKIEKQINVEGGAFLICSIGVGDSSNIVYSIEEKNQRWSMIGVNQEDILINTGFFESQYGDFSLRKLNLLISFTYNKTFDKTLVEITGIFGVDTTQQVEITDRYEQPFILYSSTQNDLTKNCDLRFYKIIEGEIPDNYYIYINDEKVEIM